MIDVPITYTRQSLQTDKVAFADLWAQQNCSSYVGYYVQNSNDSGETAYYQFVEEQDANWFALKWS